MPHKDPEARRLWQSAYNADHLEKIRAYKAEYYAKNKDNILAEQSSRYALHREKILASHKRYREINREKIRKQRAGRIEKRRITAAAWRAKNSESIRAANAAWYKAHPEKNRANQQRRKARKRGAVINDFTAAQWREMQIAYNHRCVYCGRRAKGHLTQDHITPLSKGGNHTLSNIVPACKSCNCSKKDGPVPSPVQPLLLL